MSFVYNRLNRLAISTFNNNLMNQTNYTLVNKYIKYKNKLYIIF